MIPRLEKINLLFPLFLFLVCYFPIFLHLENLGIRMWDEARIAVSAFEMATRDFSLRNLIVTTFDNQPDFYYTKPPLLLWFQALFMKLFGFNELAVRLPVAMAVLFTALLLYFFCANVFKNKIAGFLSAVSLVCTNGYIDQHVARTGDVDGFMIFWITLFALYFFRYLHDEDVQKRKRHLLITIIGLTCAVLTKGIAGMLFIPGIFLYVLFEKKAKAFFSDKNVYLFSLVFILPVAGFYLLREFYSPGYLQSVWVNELGGRYNETIEGHDHPFGFYFSNLMFDDKWLGIKARFLPMLFFIPLVIFINLFLKDNPFRAKITKMGLFVCITYLLIISMAKTKLLWYDAPVYPVAAMIIGLGLAGIFSSLCSFFNVKNLYKHLLLVFFTVSFFLHPYMEIIDKVYVPKESWDQLKYGHYLNKMAKEKPEFKNYTVTDHGYNGHLLFYIKALKHDKNMT